MKNFQDRLFKDFDVRQELQKNGRVKKVYVYKGEYAVWEKSLEEVHRYKRLCRNSAVLLCVCYAWAALQRISLNSSKISGCITLLSFAAVIALVMGVFQFVRSSEKMYLRDCRQMRDMVLWSSIIYFILQVCNLAVGVIYVFVKGADIFTVFVLGAYGISGFLALVIFLVQNKLRYKIVERKGRMLK